MNLKAKLESSISHFGFKGLVPGGFNVSTWVSVGQPAPQYCGGKRQLERTPQQKPAQGNGPVSNGVLLG
jgi:hypothetical protein